MDKHVTETIEHVAKILHGDVLGVPVWVLSAGVPITKEWRRAHHRYPPPAMPGAQYAVLGVSRGLILFAKIRALRTAEDVVVAAGPFPGQSFWLSGDTTLRNSGDGSVKTTVPAAALTAIYVSTVFSCLRELARKVPDSLSKAFDDIGLENIRRIGAALAEHLDLTSTRSLPSALAPSLHRVPALGHFLARLSPDKSPKQIQRVFEDITAGLPVGFHLADLLARSLIRPTRYDRLCASVFRTEHPLGCVMCDLQRLWHAILCHRVLPPTDGLYEYRCHAGYTEVFSPLFVRDVALGAVFAGQVLRSAVQKRRVRDAALRIAPSQPLPVLEWYAETGTCSDRVLGEVRKVCRGLADFTGMTFAQWSRAETESEIRAGLLEAASQETLRGMGSGIAQTMLRFLDLSECSLWTFAEGKLVLLATTAPWLWVDTRPGGQATRVPSTDILGTARYDLGEGLTGRVPQTREAILVRSAEAEPGWRGKYSETPPDREVQFLAIPLVREGELCGVLRASKYSEAAAITEGDFALAKSLAEEIAILLREKSLAEQAQEHADSFEYIIKVGAHEFRGPLQNIVSLLTRLRNKTGGLSGPAAVKALAVRQKAEAILDRSGKQEQPNPTGPQTPQPDGSATSAKPSTGVSIQEFRQALSDAVGAMRDTEEVRLAVLRDAPELIKRTEEQALRAKQQMNNALAFNARIPFNFQQNSLGALLQAAEREFDTRGADRKVVVSVWDSAKHLPPVRIDSERMAQVITNLLDNAVKYSFNGETVHVRGRVTNTTVQFSVENKGTGIPDEFRQKIFEPFQRKVVDDKKRFISGTGLGLPIVREIVTAHGGRVSFASVPFLNDPARQGPEHGHTVTFTVVLPKPPVTEVRDG